MHMQDLIGGIEAILFASANPMTESDLKKVVSRWVMSLPPETAQQVDEASANALQLEASEPVDASEAHVDGSLARSFGEAEKTAAHSGSFAQNDDKACAAASDELKPEPEAQADGDTQEPTPIGEADLQPSGSRADVDVEAEAKGVHPIDEPEEKAVHTGRLTVEDALPRVRSASDDEASAGVDVVADDHPVADDQAAVDVKVAADDEAAAAKAQTPADEAATPAPILGPAQAQTRFDWRKNFKAAVAAVKFRWQDPPEHCGFTLVEVADALTFRSNPRFAPVLLAMRDDKPPKLSRAAMETLAIIAYRQPVTKPESDHIRGVDCGGTIKMLLDRNLIRIVGKKEEPGRPLLYGTGPEFLSFFNLASVHHLPSLRAFDELNDDSEDALRELDAQPSLQELSAQAKQFRLDDEPAMGSLDAAVDALRRTESTSRDALAEQGISLAGDEDDKLQDPGAPAPTQH